MNRSWKSEDRYFAICPRCGERFPQVRMTTIKKADRYNCRNLTKLCNNCYSDLLDYLAISDIEL